VKRHLWRGAAALAAGLLLLEGAWFGYVFSRPRPALRADMLAVYGGETDRYEAGWDVEREGKFRYLVFSDASPALVASMEHVHGTPRSARLLLEPNAHTTDQNARYVGELVRDNGCRSLLVITSWWHLPRALMLTHLALLGSGVDIAGLASDRPPMPVWRDPNTWMESARFWGSLLTFASDTRRSSYLTHPLVP
jgi:uncharacterized SAM-binding protein YcdF (DUF218 family)